MRFQKVFYAIIFSVLLFLSSALHAEGPFTYNHATVVTPEGVRIDVEIADTVPKRSRGLSFRESVPPLTGMLFIFDSKAKHSFWMKDTLVPLDIIWLNNHRIVHIEHSVPVPPPNTQNPPTLHPSKDANFVLELAAGEAHRLKLTPGSRLKYLF